MSDQFKRMRGWTDDERDKRVGDLAGIASAHVAHGLSVTLDLIGFEEEILAVEGVEDAFFKSPWFYSFHCVLSHIAASLLFGGTRDRVELIFDDHYKYAPQVRKWYPLLRLMVESVNPDAGALLPNEVMFRNDEEFLPLQASDMFAYPIRRKCERLAPGPCDWVVDHLRSTVPFDVKFIDRDMARSIVRGMEPPSPELLKKFQEIEDADC